jgi:peptide deformylase
LNGVTKAELQRKSLGHDLVRTLARAEGLGLAAVVTVSTEEREQVILSPLRPNKRMQLSALQLKGHSGLCAR